MADQPDDRQDEADRAEPGDIFSAAGKVYRKLPDGTVVFLGYQKQEAADGQEHA